MGATLYRVIRIYRGNIRSLRRHRFTKSKSVRVDMPVFWRVLAYGSDRVCGQAPGF